MNDVWDLAIVGGGASGMTAAIAAARCGDRVLLLEKSNALGRKVAASGNGRCNLMNSGPLQYYGEEVFARQVFEKCSRNRVEEFCSSLGIRCCEENEGRMYPCSYQAVSVLDAMKNALRQCHVHVRLQAAVTECTFGNSFFQISCSGEKYGARRLLIAAGGAASPKLGGTESGYNLLQSFGHRILPIRPSLCPILTDKKSISGLAGIRVRCNVHLMDEKGNREHSTSGEVLFTETGISGICAMQMARHLTGGVEKIELDFASRVFTDEHELRRDLQRRRHIFRSMPAENLMTGMLVPKLGFAVMKQAGIPLKGEPADCITDKQIELIIRRMYHYTLQVQGTKGFDEAQVTAGGALCSEFEPATMESLILSGLHASGEVLNVDGECGGYNLMFALASGILAGENGRKDTGI